jgi:predicted nucleic acid-binding protein
MSPSAESLWFVDSNVLLYRIDPKDAWKNQVATLWLDTLWKLDLGRVSSQVVHEFYANATRKFHAPADLARRWALDFAEGQPLDFSFELVARVWYWEDAAQLRYWDALILAAAEQMGCRYLLSEDFQSGREYGSVRVVNPFAANPAEFFPSA